jgi:hypothetical protein
LARVERARWVRKRAPALPIRASGSWAAAAACGAVLVWSTNALAAGAALEQLTLAQVLAL